MNNLKLWHYHYNDYQLYDCKYFTIESIMIKRVIFPKLKLELNNLKIKEIKKLCE